MADIPSSTVRMNDVEISPQAAVSEALFNKIGANINALLDYTNAGLDFQLFTVAGTFNAPTNTARALILAVGGGGGGGSGGTSSARGASGGSGVISMIKLATFGAGASLAVGIAGSGAGGTVSGDGGTGGTTTFPGLSFFGAPGGKGFTSHDAFGYTSIKDRSDGVVPLSQGPITGGFGGVPHASLVGLNQGQHSQFAIGGGALNGQQFGGGGGGGDGDGGGGANNGNSAGGGGVGAGGGGGETTAGGTRNGGLGGIGKLIVIFTRNTG